jgi:hypothetical protein
MDFKEIYNLIGFAGIALVIIGVFALYRLELSLSEGRAFQI